MTAALDPERPGADGGAIDLRREVLTRGRVEGGLLRVDDFLNHRVEPHLLTEVGTRLAASLAEPAPDLILTSEASGIPPAVACAQVLGAPMVFAKKFLGPGDRYAFSRDVMSPTRGVEYRVEVARRVLQPGLRVAVVDDFLSRGRTAQALGEIVEEAGGDMAGCAFVIEKIWMEGRARLERRGWPVASLVKVRSLDGGRIELE